MQVNYVTQGGYSIPIYETKNYPMGLYLLNESLLFGGYLQAYDFFNKSVIPVTPPVQYLSPIYQSQVSTVSWCKLQVFQVLGNGDILSNQTINGVINSNDTITVNNIDINKVNAQNTIYILNVLSHAMNGFLKLLRLIVR